MSNEWEVVTEGRPDCRHEDFDRTTLTLDPPIAEVTCRICRRRLWQRSKPVKDIWPEHGYDSGSWSELNIRGTSA